MVVWPLSSAIRNMPFRSDSVTSPSSSIFSSLTLMRLPTSSSLDGSDAGRLRTLRALASFVGNLGTLRQGLEAIASDRAVMDEQILATVVRGDESVPLRVVEPLNGSSCHNRHLLPHTSRTGLEGGIAQPNER